MKIHEQATTAKAQLVETCEAVYALQAQLIRKIAAPYGDGSRSNMVNAETDILPQLAAIVNDLRDTIETIDNDR